MSVMDDLGPMEYLGNSTQAHFYTLKPWAEDGNILKDQDDDVTVKVKATKRTGVDANGWGRNGGESSRWLFTRYKTSGFYMYVARDKDRNMAHVCEAVGNTNEEAWHNLTDALVTKGYSLPSNFRQG